MPILSIYFLHVDLVNFMSSILVNIVMVTYNHRNYIEQAIESALMQKASFKYKLIIGEDFSTDGTREIVKRYADKYPDKIIPIFQQKNIGGRLNFIEVINKSTAKYIAILEGDDYWTDKYKLQKQVNFLENNFDCSCCFHAAKRVYEKKSKKGFYL